jgi:hypothetical protein
MDYLSVSEAARRLGAKPKDISDLLEAEVEFVRPLLEPGEAQ